MKYETVKGGIKMKGLEHRDPAGPRLLPEANEPQHRYATRFLGCLFLDAIRHAQPTSFMHRHIPRNPSGRIVVVGAGKAAGSMASALENAWDIPMSGTVVTRYGYKVATSKIKVLEAAHPVPDQNSIAAGNAILAQLQNLNADDLVVSLISGGGSALLCAPADGVSLSDKQRLNKVLLTSGAPIQVMNCIRKHVSKLKGGRLARAAMPARLISLMMSDIPGDDVSSIASGPTVADETTLKMARDFVARYRMELPQTIIAALNDPANETPKDSDMCFRRAENHLVMTPGMVLEKIAETAREAGFEVLYLGDDLEGEARELGREHAAIAIEAAREKRKLCILSGGETTVTLKSDSTKTSKGGRNTEYLLSLALHLRCEPGVYALAGDTDGVDGSEENAGAIVMPDTIARARIAGVDLDRFLDRNDSYSAFEALDNLIFTGPTMTNVNDFRAIIVLPEEIR